MGGEAQVTIVRAPQHDLERSVIQHVAASTQTAGLGLSFAAETLGLFSFLNTLAWIWYSRSEG